MQMSLSYFFCSRVSQSMAQYFIVSCPENYRRNIQLLCLGHESISLCNNSQIVRKIYSYFGIETQFGSLFNL